MRFDVENKVESPVVPYMIGFGKVKARPDGGIGDDLWSLVTVCKLV